MKNPYRTPELARAWGVMLAAAYDPYGDLYQPNGDERRGGSHSCAFWDGFHGRFSVLNLKGSISAACYRAGRDFARELRNHHQHCEE